jgi:hypothetical protein
LQPVTFVLTSNSGLNTISASGLASCIAEVTLSNCIGHKRAVVAMAASSTKAAQHSVPVSNNIDWLKTFDLLLGRRNSLPLVCIIIVVDHLAEECQAH